MLRKLLVIIPIVVLFVIALAFGAQNSQQVLVDFFIVQKQVNIATLIALFIGAGFLFGILSMLVSNWRLRMLNRRLQKQLNKRQPLAES